ncbi:hypothetical protein BH18GEM1_BH18GEM1_07730 [soil metagenome]
MTEGALRANRAAILLLCAVATAPRAARAQDAASAYTIQAVATSTQATAAARADRIRRQIGPGADVRVEYHAPYQTVRVGHFATAGEARRVLARVRALGYRDAWIAREPLPRSTTLEAGALAPGAASPYSVQVLTAPSREEADRHAERIRNELGTPAGVRVESFAAYHVVRVGRFTTQDEALGVLARVRELGYAKARLVGLGGTVATPAGPQIAPTLGTASLAGQRKNLHALRVSGPAPVVDGRLDDAAWRPARFVSDFQQKGATRGYPPVERTEVAFLYDDEGLYVGARIHLRDGSEIRAPMSPRDDAANADRLIVSLDTYRDRRTAYNFGVTAAGTRLDYYQPEDEFFRRDPSYDPVWEARAEVSSSGWTAEMRIPFSQLRFQSGDSLVWGVNIQRISPARRLYAFWVVVPGNETAWASRFGDLVGIAGVRPARRIAIVPYVAGQGVFSDADTADDPFAEDEEEIRWRYGGDFLLGLTPSLGLEATVNPDFGQIEADPALVNLTAYETFFPERRPFFLEGSQLLQGQGPDYFYSRRVGASPRGNLGDEFRDEPTETTILGAAKLIGRTSSGLGVGALAALSDRERARTFDPVTGAFGGEPVEPRTFFGVARLQREVGAPGSTIGVVGTLVRRDLAEGEPLSELLPRHAYAGGADWRLRFAGGSHEFGGFAGLSYVDGDTAALLRLQTSSARYFQRPDADHVRFDPSRSVLAGYTAGLHLARIGGAWQWETGAEARSPGFEINDAGAMATADDVTAFAEMRYRSTSPSRPWLRVDVSGSAFGGWDFGGVRQFTSPALYTGFVWRNFWKSYARVAYDTRALSNDLTRGGPLMGTGAIWRGQAGLSSDDALAHRWTLDGAYSTDEFGGWSYNVDTGLFYRPNAHLELSLHPGYERATDSRQFFGAIEGGPAETFGTRYVFAAIDRRMLYTRLRVGLALSSDAGFEFYAEPFAANGSYHDFGELVAARSRNLRLYGTDGTTIVPLTHGSSEVTDGEARFMLENADFDIRSFRSNAVFRWDWREGSTLYVVWQQNRLDSDPSGDPVNAGDLVEALGASGEDILAVKASFRLGFD